MGRWQPGAQMRLAHAGLELFLEQGYECTTVADIAERAGVTSRTFFRYFSDKREVVFAGGLGFEAHVVAALDAAPPDLSPLQAVQRALDAVGDLLTDRDWSCRRQAVIASHAELQERELSKLSSLSTAVAEALGRRGVDDAEAALAAETGVLVFRTAFERWVAEPAERPLADLLAECFRQLRVLAGGSAAAPA